jgi:hypothetical protein
MKKKNLQKPIKPVMERLTVQYEVMYNSSEYNETYPSII